MTEPIKGPPLEKARPVIDDVGVRGVEALRKASKGWNQIRAGEKETRQQRILREQREKSSRIKNGGPANQEDTGWKPGDDDGIPDEAPSLRNLMESHKRMQKENAQKRYFEGTPDLVVLKMVQLFEDAKKVKPEIVSVEESGFNTYKVIYLSE